MSKNSKSNINALGSETPAKAVEAAQDIEMYEAATLLGTNAEIASVEFAFDAQSEIALAHE